MEIKFETNNSIAFPVDSEEEALLGELRDLLRHDPDFVSPLDAPFLLRALRWRKHDVQKAVEAVRNAFKIFEENSEIGDIVGICLRHYVNHPYQVFKYRDCQGSQVVLWEMAKWNPEVSAIDMFRSQFCFTDLVTNRQLTQIAGVVFLIDLKGMSGGHVKSLGVSTLRTMLQFLNGYPLKIKGIHIIHNPSIFNTIWSFIRVFLKTKIRKRWALHGNDLNSLHKHISPEILPKCYGGFLEDNEFVEEGFISEVLARMDYVAEEAVPGKYGHKTK